ncbi:response regulator [Oscillatoria sp. FACHB-1407]|uniref:response regulator n=1 Tax=Oscillatoria sp. FACHB-1407 TaxID=2692847 RepID=UPI001687F7B7|nr:response regulator [Oscillatoria sp. FACHB-1407]MBD2464737.1 response regulator [Oscillatoria sp. FACHB-1407]
MPPARGSTPAPQIAPLFTTSCRSEQIGKKDLILVVDDNLDNISTLSLLLQKENYTVRQATSGAIALRTIKAQLPDLILLDIRMAEMNGFEVCSALKRSPQTRDIPILFISASNKIEDKVKGFEAGGVDYITKPFRIQEFLIRVQHQLKIRTLQRQLETKNAQLQQDVYARQRAEEKYRSIIENASVDNQSRWRNRHAKI